MRSTSGRRATAITLAAVALATIVGWYAIGHKAPVAAGGWPATKVALAGAEYRHAPRALHGVGELEAIHQVALASETAGRIVRIAFSPGQRVREGDLLVQIQDAPEQADRQRLRAQLRHAQTTLARARRLMTDKAGTQEQLDNAQAAHDMARGELQRIEAVIAQKAIRAPFSGTIGIRRVHEGQYLQAGDTIASLVDADTMHVNFALDERALPQLQQGQPVEVRVDAWPERRFAATVRAMDPLIGKSRTVQVQASMPNDDGALQAGMFASIRVQPPLPSSVLTVPETAVTYTAYGQSVFVATPDAQQALTVRRVAVRTGERWDGLVEITAGLAAGDKVVVSGQVKLSDGMTVEAVAQDALQNESPAVTPDTSQAQADAQEQQS